MDSNDVRVLIVDDDEAVRTTMRNILTMYGWSVTAAANGTKALALVRESSVPFQLMIVDLVLDGNIGGLGLADILHRIEPEASFLFVSGYVDPGVPKETLPGVPKDFLGKPLSVRQLIDRASRLLQRSEPFDSVKS